MSFDEIILAGITIVFSVICSVKDLKTKSVPNMILITGILLVLCYRFIFFHSMSEMIYCLITAACTGGFYFLIRCITAGRLGMADVLFGIFQGLVLDCNITAIFLCIMIECGFALVAFFVFRKKAKLKKIPFIPFMACGLIISYLIKIF